MTAVFLRRTLTPLPVPHRDPAQIRASARAILRRAEFKPPARSWWSAAVHWVLTELGKLLSRLLGLGGGSGTTAWIAVAVLAVVVAPDRRAGRPVLGPAAGRSVPGRGGHGRDRRPIGGRLAGRSRPPRTGRPLAGRAAVPVPGLGGRPGRPGGGRGGAGPDRGRIPRARGEDRAARSRPTSPARPSCSRTRGTETARPARPTRPSSTSWPAGS